MKHLLTLFLSIAIIQPYIIPAPSHGYRTATSHTPTRIVPLQHESPKAQNIDDTNHASCVPRSQHVRIQDLEMVHWRAQYSQRVADIERHKEYTQIGIPAIWASRAAQDIHTRCTIINFLNGPINSAQYTPASQLPADFREDFSSHSYISQLFYGESSMEQFEEDFESQLNNKGIDRYQAAALPYARALMRQWRWYDSEQFQEFIQTLPGYEAYMLEIAAQLRHDAEFRDRMQDACSQAATHIQCEAKRIPQKLLADKRIYDEQRIMVERTQALQAIWKSQEILLETSIEKWLETNPNRAAAYQKTIDTKGTRYTKNYLISEKTYAAIQNARMHIRGYTLFDGNHLQHELMAEIIEGIERFIDLAPPSLEFDATLYKQGIHVLDDAYRTNELCDCSTTAELIDFGMKLYEYCTAAAQGAFHGVYAHAKSALATPVQIMLHPVESFVHAQRALHSLAFTIGRWAHEYIPPVPPECYLPGMEEQWELYAQECERVAHRCDTAVATLQAAWERTPTAHIIENVAYIAAGIPTNIFLTRCCAQLLAIAARCALPYVIRAAKSTTQLVSELEWRNAYPGMLLLHAESIATEVVSFGKNTLSLSHDVMTMALQNLESTQVGGCLKTVHQSITDFGHISGAHTVISGLFEHCAHITQQAGRARGRFGEIVGAFYARDVLQEIVEAFEVKIPIVFRGRPGEYVADIVTPKYIIECKCIDWDFWMKHEPRKIDKIYEQIQRAASAGAITGKQVILLSQNKIPQELETVRQKLLGLNIIIIEGYHDVTASIYRCSNGC